MVYNPFGKRIDQLTEYDLGMLVTNQVAEGYCIEYKSVLAPSKAIGKNMASFANTYGRWFFAGVASDAHTNIATGIRVQWSASLPGIDQDRLIFPVLPAAMRILVVGWAWWARGQARGWMPGVLVV